MILYEITYVKDKVCIVSSRDMVDKVITLLSKDLYDKRRFRISQFDTIDALNKV